MGKLVISTGKGNVLKIEGVDIVGNSCDEKIAIFEKALGDIISSTEKMEYYENQELNTVCNYETE